MKLTPGAKRAAIFVYYDADGVVDDYVPLLMRAVKEHCTHLLCMVNGSLTDAGQAALAPVCDELIFRKNEGLDITAYKEGYWHLRDTGRLSDADELLFFNQTVFGPVYPFAETFAAMNEKDLDFWGMTRHRGLDTDLSKTQWSIIPYGYMPPHIQSYFFAVRRSMFDTDAFRAYWDGLPVFQSYVEAVALHEVCFTKRFADLGFSWDVYAHTDELEPFCDYPLMGIPAKAIRSTRCPVVKRKSFLCGTTDISTLPHGGAVAELYRFLKEDTAYDTGLIVQNITRTAPDRDYTEAMALSAPLQTPQQAFSVTAVIYADRPVFAEAALRELAGQAAQTVVLCPEEKQPAFAHLPDEVIAAGTVGLCALAAILPRIETEYLLYLDATPTMTEDGLEDMELFANALAALRPVQQLAAGLAGDENLGMVLPLSDSHLGRVSRDVLWPAQYPKLLAVLSAAGIHPFLSAKKAPVRMDGGFLAKKSVVAPLAGMDVSGLAKSAGESGCPADYLPAVLCQAAGKLCAFGADRETAMQRVIALQAQLDTLTAALATPNKLRIDQLAFRGQAIVDFYQQRRHSMTLDAAFAGPLSAKEKLWIVLQILLSQKSFDRLYRLTHGGHSMPAPQYPPDPLD